MSPLESKSGVSTVIHWGYEMKWTDERVAKLVRLWGEGYSGGEIAEVLGWTTRSAVLGKLHRMGITRKVEDNEPND